MPRIAISRNGAIARRIGQTAQRQKLHRWRIQHCRYGSVSLGAGGRRLVGRPVEISNVAAWMTWMGDRPAIRRAYAIGKSIAANVKMDADAKAILFSTRLGRLRGKI